MHGQHWECRESGWLSYLAKLGTQRSCWYRCEESLGRDAGVSLSLPLRWVEGAGRRADVCLRFCSFSDAAPVSCNYKKHP